MSQFVQAPASEAPLSIPLCLVTLFKSLDENHRLRVVDDAQELAKLAKISSDFITGLAPTQGNGPLASTAATVKSFTSLGKLVTACSMELRAMCENPTAKKDVSQTAQTDGEEQIKMLNLAQIRLSVLQALCILANSDQRITDMVQVGIAKVTCEDLLDCPSSNFDLNGLKAACDLMRNICIPAQLTIDDVVACGGVSSLATAAIAKARDQNAAAAAAAGIRLLLEKGGDKPNGSMTNAGGGGGGEMSTGSSGTKLVALSLAPKIELILGMDLATTHPFVRVELARCLALAAPLLTTHWESRNKVELVETAPEKEEEGPGEGSTPTNVFAALSVDLTNSSDVHCKTEKALDLLCSKDGVEYISFLFASDHDHLHRHALLALVSLTDYVMAKNSTEMEKRNTAITTGIEPIEATDNREGKAEEEGASLHRLPLFVGATVTDQDLMVRLEEILKKRSELVFTDLKAFLKCSNKYNKKPW